MVKRFLFGTLLLAVVLMGPARGAALSSDDYLFLALDGGFRDPGSLSRYEKANALSQLLFEISRAPAAEYPNEDALRAQVRAYWTELTALGVEVRGTTHSLRQWQIEVPAESVRGLQLFTEDEEWWSWNRMAAVDAYWTDPSSPLLRLAGAVSTSSPLVVCARRAPWDVLSDSVEVEAPSQYDFVIPVLALSDLTMDVVGTLSHQTVPTPAVAFKLSPSLPPQITTLQELARLGLPAASSSASPVALESPLPVATMPSYRTLGSILTNRETDLQSVTSSYEAYRFEAMKSNILEPSSRSFMDSPGFLNDDWTHSSTGLGYQLPVQNLGVNVKLDEWTMRPNLAGAGATGLDLRLQDARLNLNYALNPSISLQGGYIYSRTAGLNADNVNQDHGYPYVGFDYQISNNARWNVNIRFYNTLDIGNSTSTRGPGLNLADPQVTTEVKVRF